MLNFLIIICFWLFTNEDKKNNSIIKLPLGEGKFLNIPTKKEPINYQFFYGTDKIGDGFLNYVIEYDFISCLIEGIEDVHKIPIYLFDDLIYETQFDYIEIKNNDSVFFSKAINSKDDIYSSIICKIFFYSKYIDKNIYSYGKKFKYFGGTPQDIIKNLNKFIFNNNTENITEIYVQNNETFISFKANLQFEISDKDKEFIKIPSNFLHNNNNSLLSLLIAPTYKEKLIFPHFLFKIGNKIFNLTKEIALKNLRENNHHIYFVKNSEKIIFGREFLKLFDFKEFNLDSNEVTLYLNKNQNYLYEESPKKILKLSFNIEFIIIFLIIISTIIMIFSKNHYKNEKTNFYCYYYDIIV